MIDLFRRMLAPFPALFQFGGSVYRGVRAPGIALRRAREDCLIRRFNRLYYHGRADGAGLWQGFAWLGVPTQKCPTDLAVYQEIVVRTRPEVIVETGVNCGGSTLYLAGLFDLLDHGEVVACDITLGNVHTPVFDHPRIELIEGSSTSEETVTRIRERCAGRRTMVILDSDHREPHVREELRIYSRFVTPGCYLICEDTNINGHPVHPTFGPGPWEAARDFLRGNDDFTVDREC